MQRLFFIVMLLLLPFASFSEPFGMPVISEHLTIKNGLSNNFVTDIVQDKQGFLWIGTESGLNRFDGVNIMTFSMKNSKLVGNAIQCLYYDSKYDKLWIGTKKGLSILDCSTLRFESLDVPDNFNISNIVYLAASTDGGVWIVNHYDNIIHYNPATGTFKRYDPKNVKGLPGSYRCVVEGAKGITYFGHANEGLSVLNSNNGKIRNYRHDPSDSRSLPGNDVFCIHIDHYGNVWIGTNQGLALFDPVTEQFIRFLHDPVNPRSPIGNHIYRILEMNDSTLWIGSDMGGVSILDLRNLTFRNPEQLQFVNMEAAAGDDKSISSSNVRALFQDSFGNIWIGNYSTGIDFVNHKPAAFNMFPNRNLNPFISKSKQIWSLYEDNDGIVWIGGINNVISIKDGNVLRTYDLSRFVSSDLTHVTAIHQYNGKLILGIYDGGTLSLDVSSGVATRIMPENIGHVNSFCDTPDGKLLIGTKDGLYRYDGKEYEKLKKVSDHFFDQTPNGIVYDNQGKLWIGSYGSGVYVFDRNMNVVAHLESAKGFVTNAITQIFKDSQGGLWIAGQDGLAYIKDTKYPHRYVNYGYDNGLEDIHIRSVQEDRQGNIWLALNNAIARLNRKTNRFDNYDYNDGLPQGNFLDRSVILMSNGNLWFGSFNGICVLNPENLTVSTKVVPVQIVECQNISERTGNSTDGILIPRKEGGIVLPYDQNSVRVMFAVPDFSQSRLVEYAYMIEGIDKNWTPTQGDHYATLRNLPPGKYTFKVRARLKNQQWDDASIATMKITVRPPLWLTWWAKLIYLIIAAVAIYLFVRYYKRRLILKSSLELERRKSIAEKSLNDERLRFYTNITHELRTPLTLILGPLEDLVADKQYPQAYKQRIRTIHASALRLLNLINQILEFRKTETQNRKLTVSKGNLSSVVQEIGLRYKELNHNDKVSISIDIDRSIPDIYFDSDIIHTILNNLLSNAVKYTPEGSINLIMRSVKNEDGVFVEIAVSDTGYGIDDKALPHIFDRYYQAEGKHQASGTGIGLSLVRALSDLHEGSLSVESKVGKGTVFTFRLNANNTYPGALHKESESATLQAPESSEFNTDESAEKLPVVLVVEDNDDIRDYIETSLSSEYQILTATNGKEGVDLAKKHIPDIIISDIMMPVMDGMELCKIVKDDIYTSHIPIILLTAKDSLQDKEAGYEIGADSYLTKPFSAKLLISRIRNILESRKLLASIISANVKGNDIKSTCDNAEAKVNDVESTPLRLSKLDEEFIQKFTRLVEENMTLQDLNINYLQQSLNMSASTLYRKLKGLTGMSANEFIRKIRLRRGYELLKEGCNVSEAAYSCGFNDAGYFRNCFKEEYGMSPSQFIKQLRI